MSDVARAVLGDLDQIAKSGRMASDANAPLHRLLKTAAAILGCGSPNVRPPSIGEGEANLTRAAADHGLICRRIVVDGQWRHAGVAPLIVFEGPSEPLLLIRASGPFLGSGRWRVHKGGSASSEVLTAAAAERLPRIAYQLTPAFPQRRIAGRDILKLGWPLVRGDIVAFALATLVAGGLAALLPILTDFLIATVIPGHDEPLLADIAVTMTALLLLNLLTHMACAVTEVRVQGMAGALLRPAVIDRTIKLINANTLPASPVLATQMRAFDTWSRSVTSLGLGLTMAVLSSVPGLLYLLVLTPGISLAILLVTTVTVLSVMAINRRQTAILTSSVNHLGSWVTMSYETLKEIDTIRSVAGEATMFRRFADSFSGQQTQQRAASQTAALSQGIAAALETVAAAAVMALAIATSDPKAPIKTVPILMAALMVTRGATALVGGLASWSQIMRTRLILNPLLVEPPAPTKGPLGRDRATDLRGGLRIVHVSYRPAPDRPLILADVSLDIGPGEHVGIVGPSGAGKTTLLEIIVGLKRPAQGLVLFDGVDLSRLDAGALRRQIGIVGQNARLFSGTLQSNVCLGEPFPETVVWEALKLAGIEDDVRAMPLGLSTPVGDAVVTLSGGQVQRLLFARAIINKPKILICDEATSALDPKAQERIIRTSREAGMTVISVAHRLETIVHCDRIYAMERGTIVEHGTATELVRSAGLFSRLLSLELSVEPAGA